MLVVRSTIVLSSSTFFWSLWCGHDQRDRDVRPAITIMETYEFLSFVQDPKHFPFHECYVRTHI